MTNKNSLKDFRSVLEAEVLDEQQMNGIEAGGDSKCEQGCKKSCKNGNQGGKTEVEIIVRPTDKDDNIRQC